MIGADTTFLVQLELVELPAHVAAHQLLQRAILQPQVPLALAPEVLAEFTLSSPTHGRRVTQAAKEIEPPHVGCYGF